MRRILKPARKNHNFSADGLSAVRLLSFIFFRRKKKIFSLKFSKHSVSDRSSDVQILYSSRPQCVDASTATFTAKKPRSETSVPDGSFLILLFFSFLFAALLCGRNKYKTAEQATTYSPADSVRSTIGAGGLNFRVRHGTGWTPSAIITCSAALSYSFAFLREQD